MSLCKQINLSVWGKTHRVIELVGEESLFKVWYFDLIIQLPLDVDMRTWLSQSAQCQWTAENGKQLIFFGEIVSVKNTGEFSPDSQKVMIRLCSYLHRLDKSGGAYFFKEYCFRDIVSEFIQKHRLLSQIKVVFVSDLGTEKFDYTQQFSEESDLAFIDRYCKKQGWLWLLKTSASQRDTLYFFKKSIEFLPTHALHKLILNDSESFQRIEKVENNVMTIEINSVSSFVALGDKSALAEDSSVVSIQHYFGLTPAPQKIEQYRNKLLFAPFKTYPDSIPHRAAIASPAFQYGFVKSETPYAAVEDAGAYAIEVLSERANVSTKKVHAMQPLLGHGGELSHFSGFPTGFHGLWYDNTEVLLAEVDNGENALKICGTLANSQTTSPVMDSNKTQYQWRTPFNTALSFEEASDKQGIRWTTDRQKNHLIMGNMPDKKQGIELSASFGILNISGNQGISLVSGKKIKEQAGCSQHVVINNQWHIKNKHSKVHYEASKKAIFDFKQGMRFQSAQVHWMVKDTLDFSGSAIELNGGDLLRIKMRSGNCAIEATRIDIVGQGQGRLVLNNTAAAAGIHISDAGKVSITGSTICANGIITMKGHVKSYTVKPLMIPITARGPTLVLKEPGDLPQVVRAKTVASRLLKKLFDPFDQKIEGKCQESGWLDSAVMLNEKKGKLDGMQIEKELRKNEENSDFMLG